MPGAKKEKDPNMPKRPLTPYFAFTAEESLKVMVEHPDWKMMEVAKELSRRYMLTLIIREEALGGRKQGAFDGGATGDFFWVF